MWAILPNRSYMLQTWQNWFSAPTTFLSVCNLPLPYGSHLFFMHLPSLQEISVRGEMRLHGLRFDMYGSAHACMGDCVHTVCVLQGWGWVGCQQDSQGKGKNLVYAWLFCYRGLPPAFPWGPIKGALKSVCLNLLLHSLQSLLTNFFDCSGI